MITGFITFFTIFAVVGAILYGRKLIKTEKSDAVFGNPERAKGGMHWVVVGSSFLLLSWLYYSWDIAKSFYPKSANELCQVAKVNESLLSLKYLFNGIYSFKNCVPGINKGLLKNQRTMTVTKHTKTLISWNVIGPNASFLSFMTFFISLSFYQPLPSSELFSFN